MSQFSRVALSLLALVGLTSCGPLEIRISKEQGVRPINRTFTADIGGTNFKCGDTIIGEDSSQEYVVTSAVVPGGCQFSFDQQVEVLTEADYDTIKELKRAVRLVDRVEIEVTRLDFYDETGDRFDIETRIRDVEFWVNGQLILTRDQLGKLPQTFVLEGESLRTIKEAVKNRQTCTAHVVAKVTILDANRPTSVRCELESQPSIIISSSEI